MRIPFFSELDKGERFLVAGVGGGFDIASGMPIYMHLRKQGKQVALANLSFSELSFTDNEEIAPGAYLVTQQSRDVPYFPEKFIVDWLAERNDHPEMFGFSNHLGVAPLCAAYRKIVERLDIDTLVLVDGGTDCLIFGDEPGLGTIVEDACSMIAAAKLGIKRSYLVATAFGVDHFHGVNHHAFLENVATLIRDGAYLGTFSLTREMPEGEAFLALVEYMNQRSGSFQSIVTNSVACALQGEFGDHHVSGRTKDSELFINPLMGLQWTFDLAGVVARMQFASNFESTETMDEIAQRLQLFKLMTKKRIRKPIPL